MAWRAEREVRQARAKFGDDLQKLNKHVAKVVPAMVQCYQGEHKLCAKHSFVCDGVHTHYEYLPKFAHGTFRFTRDDSRMLSTSLQKRMGTEALRRTRFGFTTQKAEATNHFFSITNPKQTMKCSRNGASRDHSAIHMLNNLPGDSIISKTSACGVPLSPNSPCMKNLSQMNNRQQYFRKLMRSPAYKVRRALLRKRRFECYDKLHNESYYIKGQLDPK
jgi:hypothetical protein